MFNGLTECLFSYILDLVFPKQCINCDKYGSYLCSGCRSNRLEFYTENECHVCRFPTLLGNKYIHCGCMSNSALSRVYVCLRYNSLARAIIEEVKYKHHFDYVCLINDLIMHTVDLQIFRNSILIPVPLHDSKKKSRGFNQAELIANRLVSTVLKFGIDTSLINLIERRKNTKTQVGMTRLERLHNLDDAFSIRQKSAGELAVLKNKKILLIDDVMTTGTTLEECAKLLNTLGVDNIEALVFARG